MTVPALWPRSGPERGPLCSWERCPDIPGPTWRTATCCSPCSSAWRTGGGTLSTSISLRVNDASLPQSATDTPVRLDNAQGSHPSGSPADTAGVYRLGAQTYAVNRPWPEDMPDQITDEKLHLLLPEASISSMQSAEEAPSLVQEAWKLFLFFVLACLLMEALLCLPGQTAKRPSPTTRP